MFYRTSAVEYLLGNMAASMHRISSLLLVVAFVCFGCDWRQKGKFAVSGSKSHALASHAGSLTILRGHALTTDYQPTGDDTELLCWLVVCPGLLANGSGSESNEGTYRSVHKETWFAASHDVTIELAWDRRNDDIEIHSKRYKRSDGNTFVIIRDADGGVSSWQIKGVEGNADHARVMRHIREQLPDNELVATVKLVEVVDE